MYVLILVIFDLFKDFKIGTFMKYDIDIATNSFDVKLNKQWQIHQVVIRVTLFYVVEPDPNYINQLSYGRWTIMYNDTIYNYEIHAKISNILKYLCIWSMSKHVNLRSTKIGCPMLSNNSCSKWHKNQSKLSLFLWPPFDTCTLFFV